MPKYSVILPVCHGGEFLKQALVSLNNVSSPTGGHEVLVVGDKKAINKISVYGCDQAKLRIVESQGKRSEILNAACAAARGSVWVFADDDCVFPSDWLINVEKSLNENPEALVIGGTDSLAAGASGFDLALDVVLNSFLGTGGTRTDQRMKCGEYYPKLWNMIVIAAAAKKVTLDILCAKLIYDPTLFVHEDVDLVKRIKKQGGKVVFAPYVRVEHSRDTTYTEFVKRNKLMARISGQKGIHRAAHLALAAAFGGIPLSIIASVMFPMLKILFVLIYGFYILAAFATGVKGAVEKRRMILVMLVPALIVSMHFARAAGYVSLSEFQNGEAK
jgi:GT2 family glycosyltransferase